MRISLKSNRRAVAAVEFAVTAPLFFLLLFALFEFGHMMLLRNAIENACYEAARQAIVPGATAAEARQTAESILRISGARVFSVNISPATITDATEEVTVDVTLPFENNSWLIPKFGFTTELQTEVTLHTERG